MWLCQLTTSRNIVSTYVMPEAMYGDDYHGKKLITDIMAEDEEGHHCILEMQSSSITSNDLIKFQCYLGKRLVENTKISQKYQDIKSVYMLIIDTRSARKDLPRHFQENYTMRGEYDQSELPFNKMHLSIIQTKYIEEIEELIRNL
ncbi:MAG: PD-(D/E)XK nuclease family transposase [Erysipelotrichales bacterium]|nr:PD-(D/E)XK nuclease family transposase [Erysipelotrichales bacterium]